MCICECLHDYMIVLSIYWFRWFICTRSRSVVGKHVISLIQFSFLLFISILLYSSIYQNSLTLLENYLDRREIQWNDCKRRQCVKWLFWVEVQWKIGKRYERNFCLVFFFPASLISIFILGNFFLLYMEIPFIVADSLGYLFRFCCLFLWNLLGRRVKSITGSQVRSFEWWPTCGNIGIGSSSRGSRTSSLRIGRSNFSKIKINFFLQFLLFFWNLG